MIVVLILTSPVAILSASVVVVAALDIDPLALAITPAFTVVANVPAGMLVPTAGPISPSAVTANVDETSMTPSNSLPPLVVSVAVLDSDASPKTES